MEAKKNSIFRIASGVIYLSLKELTFEYLTNQPDDILSFDIFIEVAKVDFLEYSTFTQYLIRVILLFYSTMSYLLCTLNKIAWLVILALMCVSKV